MAYRLLGLSGGYAGQTVDIPPQGLVVGRDAATSQLLLAAEDVSRRHATLACSGQGLVLTDQQSSNGTYVEQEGQWVAVQGARVLQPGEKVRFGLGGNVFSVQWAAAPVPPPSVPAKGFPLWAVFLIVAVVLLAGGGYAFRDRWLPLQEAQEAQPDQTAPQDKAAKAEDPAALPGGSRTGVCLVPGVAIRSGHTITSPCIGNLAMQEGVQVLDEWHVPASQGRKEGYAGREMVAEDAFGNEYVLDPNQILMVEERKDSGAMIRFVDPDGDEILGFVDSAESIHYFNGIWLKVHSEDGIEGWVYGEFILTE